MDESLGICSLCGREMFVGSSDKHHLIPRSRGGSVTEYLHRICHTKIHHTFTEKELEKQFNSAEKLLENDDIKRFVEWVQKKDPEFIDKNEDTSRRKKKRRR